jgi:hypothetical protein
MTLEELIELRGAANQWAQRIKSDPSIDPGSRVQLLAACGIFRDYAKARVSDPRTSEVRRD